MDLEDLEYVMNSLKLLDASGASTAVALKVLRELLLKLEEKHIK